MKICLVCSDGGHLTQILQLMPAFEQHDMFFITYEGSRAKDLSRRHYTITNIDKNIYRFIFDFAKILFILIKERPNLIISTGSEIAIPTFYFGWLLNIKRIYIESLTRVTEPSFTGKWVYPVADVFLVQWEKLLKRYGKKAQYWGSVF